MGVGTSYRGGCDTSLFPKNVGVPPMVDASSINGSGERGDGRCVFLLVPTVGADCVEELESGLGEILC